MNNMLSGKVAVVTGGNSGIGKGIVKKFHQEGAMVAAFGRNPKTLEAIKSEISNDILTIQGDANNIKDIHKLFDSTQKVFGKITTLICSAGIGGREHIKDADFMNIDMMFNTNVRSLILAAKESIDYLTRYESSILFISSIAAHVSFSNSAIYSATKAAVSNLASCLSIDLARDGIRVNAISPGFVETPMYESMLEENPKLFDIMSANVPLKRLGTPIDIANGAAFLSSDNASYITGIDLVIDGGFKHNRSLQI